MQQGFGLLGRVCLLARIVLDALIAIADRQQPVAAHLQIIVQGLHGFIVERVFRRLALGRPDHRFVGVCEPAPPEVRHRVGFAPDHIVQNPETEILQDRADTEDVVIAADHPDRAVV